MCTFFFQGKENTDSTSEELTDQCMKNYDNYVKRCNYCYFF